MKLSILLSVFLVYNCSELNKKEKENSNIGILQNENLIDKKEDYPEGNYGLKPIVREIEDKIFIDKGNIFPNICMLNHKEEEVCLEKYYRESEKDLLVVDYSFYDCPPCAELAENKKEIKNYFKNKGWGIEWITILVGKNDDLEKTKSWNELYGGNVFLNKEIRESFEWDKWPENIRAYPTIQFVNLNSMLVYTEFFGYTNQDIIMENFLNEVCIRLYYAEKEAQNFSEFLN